MVFWLLTSEFPPAYGGGISTYSFETAKMFALKGHKVSVFTQDETIAHIKEEEKDNVRVIRFNPTKFYTYSFLGYEANLSYAFAQIVKTYVEKESSPDIIEAQDYMGIAYYLLQFKYLNYPSFTKTKIAITLHSPAFLYLEYNKVIYHRLPYYWIAEMEKFCILSADILFSPSEYLIKELKKRIDLSKSVILILENPYEINWPLPNQRLKKNNFIFFGKLTPQKGCLELIEYFKKLWSNGKEYLLSMIGDGNHLYHPEGIDMIDFIRKKYKNEIRSGLLKLSGRIPPEQLNNFISGAHIIIVPSIVDNLPYTVLEAMAQGKIVLASIQGGQAEIIEDKIDGFLFDYENPESFYSQLEVILRLDENQINKIAEKAYTKVKTNYSYEVVYRKKIDLLNELITKELEAEYFPFTRKSELKHNLEINDEDANSLLSVVIPFYNMGRYVEETIQSLKNSTYENLEIIIVNDGSDDFSSVELLRILEKKYSLKILHQKNQGLPSARNAGALLSQGEFLTFLDPDDTIDKEYYQKSLQVLKKYKNVYFVGCWAKYFGSKKGYWPAFNPEPPYLLIHNMVNSSSLVYKKSAFLRYGMNDKRMIFGMEDYESVINMVKNGCKGVVLPEPLWNYRIRKKSMARSFTKNKQLYLYRLIADKHADIYSANGSEVSNILNANGSGINYDNPTLFYNISGRKILGNRLINKIVSKIKSNSLVRKTVIRLKNYFD